MQPIRRELLLVYADAIPPTDFVKLVSVTQFCNWQVYRNHLPASPPNGANVGGSLRTQAHLQRFMYLEAAVQVKACNLLSTGELWSAKKGLHHPPVSFRNLELLPPFQWAIEESVGGL